MELPRASTGASCPQSFPSPEVLRRLFFGAFGLDGGTFTCCQLMVFFSLNHCKFKKKDGRGAESNQVFGVWLPFSWLRQKVWYLFLANPLTQEESLWVARYTAFFLFEDLGPKIDAFKPPHPHKGPTRGRFSFGVSLKTTKGVPSKQDPHT